MADWSRDAPPLGPGPPVMDDSRGRRAPRHSVRGATATRASPPSSCRVADTGQQRRTGQRRTRRQPIEPSEFRHEPFIRAPPSGRRRRVRRGARRRSRRRWSAAGRGCRTGRHHAPADPGRLLFAGVGRGLRACRKRTTTSFSASAGGALSTMMIWAPCSAADKPRAQVLVEVRDRDGVGELAVTFAGLAEILLRAVQKEEARMRSTGIPGDLEDREGPGEGD